MFEVANCNLKQMPRVINNRTRSCLLVYLCSQVTGRAAFQIRHNQKVRSITATADCNR